MDEPEQLDEWFKKNTLGSGSFGIVTLWMHKRTGETVAIKKCRIHDKDLEQKHRDRWTEEVERMKKIENDNIVSFEKLPISFEKELLKYNPSNLPMLSMEYCSHGDLRRWLSKAENCCGFKESEVRYILSDMMNAIVYLHKLKITHRDLKPENIVLKKCDRRNRIIYKLIDLGYAKEIDTKSVSASFVGTLQYLAPELLYSKTYSCSVDYWSFGLLAFEIICGIRPFLPNSNVSKWMFEVHKKQSDVICIYENHEDNMIFSKEMYTANHISSCFKQEMEKWLRIALEYQPRKRGYLNDPNKKENKLVIFSLLESILRKQFLNVFIVYTLETYSYEIDNCTLVSTLQGWIAIDTKIPISEQILLSDCCENIAIDGFAVQFFDKNYKNVMLFVFKKGAIVMDTVKLEIPQILQKYMEIDLLSKNTNFKKRAFSLMLHFILSNTNKYNTLLGACSLKLKRLCQNTHNSCKNMNGEMEKLLSKCNYSKELLDIDLENYLKNYKQNATHWLSSFENILEKIETVNNARKKIYNNGEAVCRRIMQLSASFDEVFTKHDFDLNNTVEQAISSYYDIVDKMKKREYSIEDGKVFFKLFYDFFKTWKAHMEREIFRNFLRVIIETEEDIEKMNLTIETAISNIHKYQKVLLEDHKNRQNKIWEFTIKQKHKAKTIDSASDTLIQTVSIPTNLIRGKTDTQNIKQATSLTDTTQQTICDSLTFQKTYKSCPIMNLSHADMSSCIAELVQCNNSLMQQIQEKTKEGYKQLFEDTFDFSFLNDKI